MTQKQKEVLDQVHELLAEHFDGAVYIVEMVDVDGTTEHQQNGGHTGGAPLAAGLCLGYLEYLKMRLCPQRHMPPDRGEDSESVPGA